jgi:hypothetical protein
MVQSAENEVAELAKEAARADSMARAAKKAELGHAQQLELQRLKVRLRCVGLKEWLEGWLAGSQAAATR